MADSFFLAALIKARSMAFGTAFYTPQQARQAAEAIDSALTSEKPRILNSGTVFPSSPATNNTFFRTDQGLLFYFDGSRWLTVNEYVVPLTAYTALPGTALAATNTALLNARIPNTVSGSVWVTHLTAWTFVATTNNSTNFWTLQLVNDAGTNIGSGISTGATPDAVGVTTDHVLAIPAGIRSVATDHQWELSVIKTLTPGNILCGASVHMRIVGS